MGLREGAGLQPARQTERECLDRGVQWKVQAEYLSINWFMSLDGARRKCEAWRGASKEVRPRSAIGNKTAIELRRMANITGQPPTR